MMDRESGLDQVPWYVLRSIRSWALWSVRPSGLAFILTVEVIAPVLTAVALLRDDLSATNWIRVGVLLVAAIAYGEACDRIERFRRFLGDGSVRTNHLSVWTVAAILVVPAGLAAALVMAIYAHVLLVGRRGRTLRPHRMLFTAAAATVATWVAAQGAELVAGRTVPGIAAHSALPTIVALLLFLPLDALIVSVGAFLATRPARFRAVLPNREALGFEGGTEVIGVVVAQLLLRTPWLLPVSFGFMVVLHRASLVKQLQLAACTDAKTALLNASAWRERASAAIASAAREGRRVAVMVIDLDHFKLVNDTHGHLVGDLVLREVGRTLKRETRANDLVGRFGGEEFVVLVDGRASVAHALDMATRIRERISTMDLPGQLRVTATIGLAHCVPASADGLDQVLEVADAALYGGKTAGRDRVHAAAV
jgi:diguanylate cyclase (GGDEF)-like protein